DKTLTLNWLTNRLRISVNEEITATFANDVYADLIDLAGNVTANVLLIDSTLDTSQAPTGEDNTINLTSDQSEGIINNNGDYTINSGAGVTGGTINVDPLTSGISGTLPKITINTDDMVVEIPANTTITGTEDWNGLINIPTVKEITSVVVPADDGYTTTTNSVIEIGFGDKILTFNQAVRLKFINDAGKLVGYNRGDVFTKITTVCSADSQTAGDAESDCKKRCRQ
ncbi:MAG: hypothetical protein V1765_03060, partial [bacterium]